MTRSLRAPRAPHSARPWLEQLEVRTVPNATLPAAAHGGALRSDVAHLTAEFRQLAGRLAANPSPTIVADLQAIRTDVTALTTDLRAGKDLSGDLATLRADATTLFRDLGPSLSRSLRPTLDAIAADLRGAAFDLTASAGKGGRGDPRAERRADTASPDVSGALKAVLRDLTNLEKDLGSGLSPTLTADLAALRADVEAIAAGVRAGTDVSAAVEQALTDGLTLLSDLGPSLSPAVQRDVLNLIKHGAEVVVGLSPTPPSPASLLASAQNELAELTQALGSNVSGAVAADLQALQADLSAVAADVQAGTSVTSDVRQALRDEARLFGDLNGQLTGEVTGRLAELAFYLFEFIV